MRTLILHLVLAASLFGQHDNVILIILDDVGSDRIASFGAQLPGAVFGPTPGLDLLAQRGVRYSRAYSHMVCSPTRAGVLTGCLPHRTGVGTGIPWNGCASNPNGCFQWNARPFVTLPQALGGTHRTGAFGKWHLSLFNDGDGWQHPIDEIGFDYFSGAKQNLPSAGALGYFLWERNRASPAGNSQALVADYATSVNVDDALRWIEGCGGAPFFVWLAFNAAHTPLHDPPAELVTIAPGGSDSSRHQAMIEAADHEIVRLVTSLRPAVLRRTWIIVVGDNGNPPSTLPVSGSWPTSGKSKPNPWEGNVRVPLLVMGPDVKHPGREVVDPVHVVDLFATICDLAGVDVPATGVDSISFARTLLRPDLAGAREYAYGEGFVPNGPGPYTKFQWYITDGRWKLGKYSQSGNENVGLNGMDLYDLDADLTESNDLLDAPLGPEAQAALDGLLAAREAVRR